jgi:hypothetical protein
VHAGETVLVRVTAARAGRPVTEGLVTAEFWAPGRDPEHDPAARADPDHAVPASFDAPSRRWLARVPTAGWTPGTWTVRGRVAGDNETWAWVTFGLG